MNRKWLGVVALIVCGVALLSSESCARSQQLTGITISPSGFTYFAPAPPNVPQTPIPLTAYGTYIHPPETKDITSQVTWASDQTSTAAVSSSGGLTDGTVCGTANISATYYTDGNSSGNLMVGFIAVTVEGPASQGCPQGTSTQNLSVDVTSGAADGVIASSPAGITCGATCSAAFATGSSVALTATPNVGHAFLGWAGGCTSSSATVCNVTMDSNVIVTASFN
jgi:hypothetical protein